MSDNKNIELQKAQENYFKALERYNTAVDAFQRSNMFNKTFVTGPERNNALQALNEAKIALQSFGAMDNADELKDSSGSIWSYWPVLLAIVASCVVIYFFVIKGKKGIKK